MIRLPSSCTLFPYTTLFRSLLNSQYGLALSMGVDVEVKWNDLFAVMNQSKARNNYPYPTIDEIRDEWNLLDRKSTRLNSSHLIISYAVFCLKQKINYCHVHV